MYGPPGILAPPGVARNGGCTKGRAMQEEGSGVQERADLAVVVGWLSWVCALQGGSCTCFPAGPAHGASPHRMCATERFVGLQALSQSPFHPSPQRIHCAETCPRPTIGTSLGTPSHT